MHEAHKEEEEKRKLLATAVVVSEKVDIDEHSQEDDGKEVGEDIIKAAVLVAAVDDIHDDKKEHDQNTSVEDVAVNDNDLLLVQAADEISDETKSPA